VSLLMLAVVLLFAPALLGLLLLTSSLEGRFVREPEALPGPAPGRRTAPPRRGPDAVHDRVA
jgi:hypothetical protein